jgi:CheY-like chemotaxis protein
VRFALDATRTALLVDDEITSRATHHTRLEGEGYTVFVAQNQADAISRAKQTLPKVIFVHLAAAGNMALIQALRSDDSCRHIPVVVIKDPAYVSKVRSKLHAVPHDSW